MKKKIIIFMLLLSFLVGVGVPDQAKAATETTADDVKYRDIEDFMHGMGYNGFNSSEDGVYLVFCDSGKLYVLEILGIKNNEPYACRTTFSDSNDGYIMATCSFSAVNKYIYYDSENASKNNNFEVLESGSHAATGTVKFLGQNVEGVTIRRNNFNSAGLDFDNLIYSDLDVFNTTVASKTEFFRETSSIVYESNLETAYSFPLWCQDAGLNCLASSNESSSVIPYSYNSYWHIVRRNASGQWLLITIGNSVMSENISDYTLLQLDNGNLGVWSLYAGEDYNGYLLNVRQYIYDTDGWKVQTYVTYHVDEDDDLIIDLGAGSGFDDYRLLAYTNSDIYSETGLNLVHPASSEYYDVTDTPVVPDEPDSPTSTPSNPSGGSGSDGGGIGGGTRPEGGSGSSVGGQAKPGGMLDFIITFFTMVWTKLFAVEVPVDGYQISFQAIVIFGVIAGVLIWLGKSSFGKKG